MSWLVTADDAELKMGIEAEKEHTDTIKWLIEKVGGDPTNTQLIEEVARRIAQDHLREMKSYYTRLKKMEQGG